MGMLNFFLCVYIAFLIRKYSIFFPIFGFASSHLEYYFNEIVKINKINNRCTFDDIKNIKEQITRTICLTLFHPINTPVNSTISALEFVINYIG